MYFTGTVKLEDKVHVHYSPDETILVGFDGFYIAMDETILRTLYVDVRNTLDAIDHDRELRAS